MGPTQIVVLTGAGISAESGLKTFRETNGLWEEYSIMDVATPDAWRRNRKLVLDFYNMRRRALSQASPNTAHLALAELEKHFRVRIVTQNVDDLHERAGSTEVLHLHGELRKVRSERYPHLVYQLEGDELNEGDLCEKGTQLRPHIVWFGEEVPLIGEAALWMRDADILMVIGTSLNVYPAAALVYEAPYSCPKYLIDPETVPDSRLCNLTHFREKAGIAVPKIVDELIRNYGD